MKFLDTLKSMWDDKSTPPPPPKIVKVARFFLAGKNESVLWRVIAVKGKTYKEQWVKNPMSRRMEWCGSYLGEWEEDKEHGIKEINMFMAESKFPGSVTTLMARSAMRGK
jgi:hypothetical protein